MDSLNNIKEYYGKILQSSSDLKTSACCTAETIPVHLRDILKLVHDEVVTKFYGCGSPIPFMDLEGKTVLDLGSGSGRDSYILSKLVGPRGKVIGVDMTDEQLEVARRHQDYHQKAFGHASSNVTFVKGYIENLKSAGIADNSIDLVISNCVVNLSPDKKKVFAEIFRVLKPGGELYFSDVFSDRRIPKDVASDKIILGECLGGALYTEDFRRLMSEAGCLDFRTMNKTKIEIMNREIAMRTGNIQFYSITVRAFKLDLEDRCEDYGQVAYYLGTIPECPHRFTLDDHHIFETNKPMLVCSNTADMISLTHYKNHFKVIGNKENHLGLFDCSPTTVKGPEDCATGACC
ncbi:MAG: methyltransferase domain-containing protein [Bacteriovorax sp.]|jgi:ubiquinone/menaquinone biosynthesis C-methylase UbiE